MEGAGDNMPHPFIMYLCCGYLVLVSGVLVSVLYKYIYLYVIYYHYRKLRVLK